MPQLERGGRVALMLMRALSWISRPRGVVRACRLANLDRREQELLLVTMAASETPFKQKLAQMLNSSGPGQVVQKKPLASDKRFEALSEMKCGLQFSDQRNNGKINDKQINVV